MAWQADSGTTYFTCAETAKLIRQALWESFDSRTRFRVRSKTYTGGASIRVSWQDGPTVKQVDAVTQRFAGGYFDGMTDYQGGYESRFKGESVHFGATFIFTERSYSAAFCRRVWPRIHRMNLWTAQDGTSLERVPDPVFEDGDGRFPLRNVRDFDGVWFGTFRYVDVLQQELSKRSDGSVARRSKLASQVGTYRRAY